MCYKPKVKTFAMKHGLSMEELAKKRYAAISKKNHKDLKISDTGLVIYEELPYIAASPDLEVECKCCGAGLVEIKCPLIRGEILSADNLGYLQNLMTSDNKNTTVLKTNEPDYFQVQRQLGVTGRKYCDFFSIQQLVFI